MKQLIAKIKTWIERHIITKISDDDDVEFSDKYRD
jgi:hypothetical protein